jgi:hypothetical protein
VRLWIWEDVGASHSDRETMDGEETCVIDADGGAIWKGDINCGHGRSDVLQIMLYFGEVSGGTRVYNVRWGGVFVV